MTRVVGEIDKSKGGSEGAMLPDVLDKFGKSRAYNLDKAGFGFIESIFNQAESTALVLLGFM